MNTTHLELLNHRVWKDKRIKPEGKEIFAYLHTLGFDRSIFHFNIGQIQPKIRITNTGFKKNLEKLEKSKYLIYKEYDTGLYEIHIC